MLKKSYSELVTIDGFQNRFDYLSLVGKVGDPTFGYDRIFNQQFYRSKEWRSCRNQIILRDNACDMGLQGHELRYKICVHHINPVTLKDIESMSDSLFDPDNLICVSFATHNAIHFGTDIYENSGIIERVPGDTCPWR